MYHQFFPRFAGSVTSVECQCAAMPNNTPLDSREQTLPFLAILLRVKYGLLISGAGQETLETCNG